MGVAGAALATVLSRLTGLVLLLRVIIRCINTQVNTKH
jgi:Na+-driven multidrug efflux pump